jgi:SlyX protein
MPLNERVQLLEEKIAYLERHVTAQDKAMLELAEEIATLRRELKASRERSGTGAGGQPEGMGEEWGDRPPHY